MRSFASLLLFVPLAACATYRMEIAPPPSELPTRLVSGRPPLSISVRSTYAPYEGGQLSRTDLYPRDQNLGRLDLSRYVTAFTSTQQFQSVTAGSSGNGLHCALVVVSGREPAKEGRRLLSLLLLGQLSHEQREIVRLEAIVTAPGRAGAEYRLEGHITTDAVHADTTRLRRPFDLCGPENELVAALVSHIVKDGWLDTVEIHR